MFVQVKSVCLERLSLVKSLDAESAHELASDSGKSTLSRTDDTGLSTSTNVPKYYDVSFYAKLFLNK